SRKFGVIWSFCLMRVCKSTKIPFICEDGLAIEWNSKNLTELLKRESDEFVLNHKGDKNDSEVISLKGGLTIKVRNKTRDNWLINFVETVETNVRKVTIDMIRGVVKLINNSTLMNTSIFDGFVEVSNRRRDIGCLGDFGNVGTAHLPYGMFLTRLFRHVMEHNPYIDNGIYDVVERVMHALALRQACQPQCDRGKSRHSVSSTSAYHKCGSSSCQEDDDEDECASCASTPSPTTYLNSLKTLSYQQYEIPSPSEQSDDLLFERQTELLNQLQEIHKEVRCGFKSFEKALRELIHFIIAIKSARATPKAHLPYGMFLTRLFRHVMEHYPDIDNGIYDVVERVMHPLALRQACRPQCDRGKARHFVSSTSAYHKCGSSSCQEDNDEDDGASCASNPSPTTYLDSLKTLSYQQYKIPSPSEQSDDLLFKRQTELLNQSQEIHKEVRGGFKSFKKALREVFDDTKNPSPRHQLSSPSAPNAPSKTPSTKDTSSSSIDYIPKSPTSLTSPLTNGYLNSPTSPSPRVPPPPPTQENISMDITLALSPITPLNV
nr:ribosomal protein L7Ae/L30e/S12e/Gadd45 [Tanacetum cinerariifolium]